ncbi:MAG: hypothetical protein HOV80_01440 [Polyangiaceae bacterium]|nr:hypothetical protein [Polyangiaceae bacterium]
MASKKPDHTPRGFEPLEPLEPPSNVSGTRRITHEIDTKYGAGRASGSSIHPRPAPERLERKPAQVPTLRAPSVVEGLPRSQPRPQLRKTLDVGALERPSSQVCFLGTHLEALMELEALPGSVSVDKKTLSADEQMELALEAVGGVDRVPVSRVRSGTLLKLGLDPCEAFILSLVDGRATVDEIVDMSGMHELDALLVLVELRSRDIVD